MAKKQANTFISLHTPLGDDALVLQSLVGTESLSQLFHLDLDLVSVKHAIPFDKIVGQRVTIAIDVIDGLPEKRYLNGFISRFTHYRRHGQYSYYHAEVVPWLWFLTRSADCRIFQGQTAPEIVQTVFQARGRKDFRDELKGDFPKLTYCVQYRETDFAFVSRLMEEHGICYFFDHTKDKHELVLANMPATHKECPYHKVVRYKEDPRTHRPEDAGGVVTELQMRQEFRSGMYSISDYNFEKPTQNLHISVPSTVEVADNSKLEIYDYHPGKYGEVSPGDARVRLHMEQVEATHLLVSGASTCRGFIPGYKFGLANSYRTPDETPKYLLVSVRHEAHAGEQAGPELPYSNQFTAIPAEVPYRPPQSTPKPIVEGPQTAQVVGPPDEEIHTDEHRRVKVQFHWDRKGEHNEKSSCWVRVTQSWAGKGYGALFLPRVGQEVIVDFLEGDPDQPIITGTVYNADQLPPYKDLAERTRSSIRTNTYKGSGFNEIRFEDKADSEEVFIHAQKDMNEVIGHDHTTTVKNNQVITVTGHQTITVKGQGKSGKQVASNDVKGSALDVTGNAVVNASDKASITAPTSITLTCQGSSLTLEPGKITMTAGGKATVVLDANALMKASGGGAVFLDGNAKMNGNGGGTVFLDGNAKMNGSGGGTVFLDANAKVTGGDVTATANGKASVGGMKVAVAGKATVDINGGLVKIN